MFSCKVINIETKENIMHIKFEKPLNFSYKPGQFIMASIKNNEEVIKRAFSLSSSPSEENLMITIKINNQGFFTPYIFNNLKINDEMIIEGPYGKMIYDEEKNISLIAAGTGIAPMRSIFKYIYDNDLKKDVDIYYVTKTEEDILFKKDLENLKNKNNFKLNIYLSKEENKLFNNGRINLNNILLNKEKYFICGPKDFVIETSKFLKEKNIKDIKIEAW